jgi:hypothetical protein
MARLRLAPRFFPAAITLLTALATADAAFAQRVTGDFNGDGISDLAVGSPGADSFRGRVAVFFGERGTGLPAQPALTLQGRYSREYYGSALAAGDFNGRGPSELVIGAPMWNEGRGRAEIVQFLRTATGSIVPARLSFDEGTTGINFAEAGDRFGSALAAGDFDGDGFADLAIGVPYEDYLTEMLDYGEVAVLYGSAHGLNADRTERLRSRSVKAYDRFGYSLAAGDFNGDGRDELAVGAPWDEYIHAPLDADEGVVHIFAGGSTGLNGWGTVTAPLEVNARGARFGYTLGVGDFDRDGIEDLAIAAPFAPEPYGQRQAFVVVRYGFIGGGFTNPLSRIFIQRATVTPSDTALFGFALTTGDFNNDGCDDLAVGVPRHDIGSVLSAGLVNIYYGRPWRGFETVQVLHQNGYHVRGISETGDRFGWSLTAGDFNGDGLTDLAVGVPGEDLAVVDAGAVAVFWGTTSGITPEDNRLLTAAAQQPYAGFGSALHR